MKGTEFTGEFDAEDWTMAENARPSLGFEGICSGFKFNFFMKPFRRTGFRICLCIKYRGISERRVNNFNPRAAFVKYAG